ncbi:hypothetical protein Scep_003664 [Stephania cephalantha]|uniref:Uncharacterized protein n=1 Tax=Stephania cephalantha TaxID=152367 RepID=A0AAP0PVZ2_9MAGN
MAFQPRLNPPRHRAVEVAPLVEDRSVRRRVTAQLLHAIHRARAAIAIAATRWRRLCPRRRRQCRSSAPPLEPFLLAGVTAAPPPGARIIVRATGPPLLVVHPPCFSLLLLVVRSPRLTTPRGLRVAVPPTSRDFRTAKPPPESPLHRVRELLPQLAAIVLGLAGRAAPAGAVPLATLTAGPRHWPVPLPSLSISVVSPPRLSLSLFSSLSPSI